MSPGLGLKADASSFISLRQSPNVHGNKHRGAWIEKPARHLGG